MAISPTRARNVAETLIHTDHVRSQTYHTSIHRLNFLGDPPQNVYG